MNNFKDMTSAELLDIILQGNERSDEALYYVLKKRAYRRLTEQNLMHEHEFFENYEDVVDDFFLYLREGNGKTREPYYALHTIANKEAFEGWLVSTFRNYLTNRSNAEEQTCELNEHHAKTEEEVTNNQEQLINKVAQIIAYSHQVLLPRGRFIFLRALLTLPNKDNALPDKEMAEALKMSHTHYRVTAHRMKKNVLNFRKRLELGEQLRLDDDYQLMASRIDEDFCSLYTTLIHYYNLRLQHLKQEPEITALRQKHELTGIMLHEDNTTYGRLTINAFWNKLN